MIKQRDRFGLGEHGIGPRPPLNVAAACQLLADARARSVILVEGWSDEAALAALAKRYGLDLEAGGIGLIPMAGVTNLAKFAKALGPGGLMLCLTVLCDAGEQAYVDRTLQRLTFARRPACHEQPSVFVCEADLEDELIRAVGVKSVEDVLETEGELKSFRRFQEQPAHRERTAHAQLHRFMGTRALRKVRYGSLLVEAMLPDQVPRPLDLVLRHAQSQATGLGPETRGPVQRR